MMMKTNRFFLLLLTILFVNISVGQKLKPGFDNTEYIEMVKIAQKAHIDLNKWATITTVPDPQKFKFVYRSPVMGLENIWDLWVSRDSIAVISIRGSVPTATSFLANLYAAMVSAKGELQLGQSFHFSYNLSNNPKAAVHVGWLVSMAYLSGDILHKVDSLYRTAGIKDFIITGHSQGGGISFLLTSYVESLKEDKRIPADIRFKTYCSAGPKPGNLFYAYDYENLTRNGWAFNIINTADWVPQVPFSIQTINDFANTNPFTNAKKTIKKQKFPENLLLRHVYNQLSKPAKKAQKRYQRYLGKIVSKTVKKKIPDFTPPAYYPSNHYVRTGVTIVLYADEEYTAVFPDDPAKIWQHHLLEPYLYLAEKLYSSKK